METLAQEGSERWRIGGSRESWPTDASQVSGLF